MVGSVVLCTTAKPIDLAPGQAVTHCSQPLSNLLNECDAMCQPFLSISKGKARISSTSSTECAKLAVDARVYYYSTSSGVSGPEIAAIHSPKIVKPGKGNAGD
jgi:hypothetical protein